MNKDPEIKKPRPLDHARGLTLGRFGVAGVSKVRDTGALFNVSAVGRGTVVLRGVCELLGGEVPVGTVSRRLRNGVDAVALSFDAALGKVPPIVKDTGIGLGTLQELLDRYDSLTVVIMGTTEASNQGLDALRLSNGLAQEIIAQALTYVGERLRSAPTPLARQELMVSYGPFIDAINAEYAARAERRDATLKKKEALGEQVEATKTKEEVARTLRKLREGKDVPPAEALAAARAPKAADKPDVDPGR